jgi:hypothetical protein
VARSFLFRSFIFNIGLTIVGIRVNSAKVLYIIFRIYYVWPVGRLSRETGHSGQWVYLHDYLHYITFNTDFWLARFHVFVAAQCLGATVRINNVSLYEDYWMPICFCQFYRV